jgi:hypothetical protein
MLKLHSSVYSLKLYSSHQIVDHRSTTPLKLSETAFKCTHTYTSEFRVRRRVAASGKCGEMAQGETCARTRSRAQLKFWIRLSAVFLAPAPAPRAGLTDGVWRGFREKSVLELRGSPPKSPLVLIWWTGNWRESKGE